MSNSNNEKIPLTNKQRDFLDELKSRCVDGEQAPSVDEIAKVCGMAKGTAQHYLAQLQKKGWINKGRCWRSIEIL